MNDPIDLYRQTKVAQKQAERGGFIGTATALAAIAEMLIVETDVDPEAIREFGPRTGAPPLGPFPIARHTGL
jgi:hypothetical protein